MAKTIFARKAMKYFRRLKRKYSIKKAIATAKRKGVVING